MSRDKQQQTVELMDMYLAGNDVRHGGAFPAMQGHQQNRRGQLELWEKRGEC